MRNVEYSVPSVYIPDAGGQNGSEASVFQVRHERLRYIRAIRTIQKKIILSGVDLTKEEKEKINLQDIDLSRIDESLQKKLDDVLKDDHTYQRFVSECKKLLLLGNYSHPHIESIYQYGMFQCDSNLPQNYRLYTERNYIQGCDLEKYLKLNNGYVPLKEVISMAEQISSALAYCHEDVWWFCKDAEKDDLENDPQDGRNFIISEEKKTELINKYKIIHNDIRSNNIIRQENGSYVLIDFGHSFSGNEQLTPGVGGRKEGGMIIIRAPELNNSCNPDERSDIYSFGVVLYRYYAGCLPFDHCDTSKVLWNNAYRDELQEEKKSFVFNEKEFVEKRRTACRQNQDGEFPPKWLGKVIAKCLNPQPNLRYKNGKELHDAIATGIKEYEKAQREEEIKKHVGDLNAELLEKINKLQENNDSLNRQLEFRRQGPPGLQAELEQAKKENLKLSAKNDKLSNKLSELQYDNDSMKSRLQYLDDVSSKAKRLEKENRELSTNNGELSGKVRVLQEENVLLNKQLELRRQGPPDSQAELEKMKKENLKLSTKNGELEVENKALSTANKTLSKELSESQSTNRSLKRKVDIYTSNIEEEKIKREWTIFWFIFGIIAAIAVASMGFLYLYRVYVQPTNDIEKQYSKPVIETIDSLGGQIKLKDQQIQNRDSIIAKQANDIEIIINGFNKKNSFHKSTN